MGPIFVDYKDFVGSLNVISWATGFLYYIVYVRQFVTLSPFVGMSIQWERVTQKSTNSDPNPLFHSIWTNKSPLLLPRYVVTVLVS